MVKRVNCYKCKFYYVTWDQAQPHGCKGYGFKSKTFPSMAVKKSSGLDCTLFEAKHNR